MQWIKENIEKMFDELFPRDITAMFSVGKSLKGHSLEKGKTYTATRVTKHGHRWMYVIKQDNDEVTWGAEYFE